MKNLFKHSLLLCCNPMYSQKSTISQSSTIDDYLNTSHVFKISELPRETKPIENYIEVELDQSLLTSSNSLSDIYIFPTNHQASMENNYLNPNTMISFRDFVNKQISRPKLCTIINFEMHSIEINLIKHEKVGKCTIIKSKNRSLKKPINKTIPFYFLYGILLKPIILLAPPLQIIQKQYEYSKSFLSPKSLKFTRKVTDKIYLNKNNDYTVKVENNYPKEIPETIQNYDNYHDISVLFSASKSLSLNKRVNEKKCLNKNNNDDVRVKINCPKIISDSNIKMTKNYAIIREHLMSYSTLKSLNSTKRITDKIRASINTDVNDLKDETDDSKLITNRNIKMIKHSVNNHGYPMSFSKLKSSKSVRAIEKNYRSKNIDDNEVRVEISCAKNIPNRNIKMNEIKHVRKSCQVFVAKWKSRDNH